MVNPLTTRAFSWIGYQSIDDHHVSRPVQISTALSGALTPAKHAAFPPVAPFRAALYL